MDIVIEKGVPIPPVNRGSGLAAAMSRLGPGDSFVVPQTKNIATTAGHVASHLGIKIVTRREGENRRIWRVE